MYLSVEGLIRFFEVLADILQNGCFEKFRNNHIKTPVLESLFNEVTEQLWTAASTRVKIGQTLSCGRSNL